MSLDDVILCIDDLPFQTKTSTRNHASAEVMANGSKRVILEHVPEVAGFGLCFLCVDLSNKLDPLANGQVGPVGSFGSIEIIWMKQSVEDTSLVLAHVLSNVDVLSGLMFARHVRSVGGSDAIVPDGSCRRGHGSNGATSIWEQLVVGCFLWWSGIMRSKSTGRGRCLYTMGWRFNPRIVLEGLANFAGSHSTSSTKQLRHYHVAEGSL